MADSRNKGAAFERAIVKRLNASFEARGVEIECKRNLDQYQSNNLCDIEIPGYAIECKAYKAGWWFAPAWWDQVCQSANGRTPILIWKFNNKGIRVTLPLHALNPALPRDVTKTAVLDLDQWLELLACHDFSVAA